MRPTYQKANFEKRYIFLRQEVMNYDYTQLMDKSHEGNVKQKKM